MNVLKRNSLKLGKWAVVAAIALGVMVGLAQDRTPTEAGPTAQIFLSYSDTIPAQTSTVILTPNGPTRHLYIWATDIDDPTGLSGYNLELYLDGTDYTVTNFQGDPTWLSSTGRSGACQPPGVVEPDFPEPEAHAYLNCVTIGQAPPSGPTGSGILAEISLRGGPNLGPPTLLDFSADENGGTYLLNTPSDPDDCFPIQPECFIPATALNSTVIFLKCGDNTPPEGDGVVDLSNDILGTILRYQMDDSDPEWDPGFDLNDDGLIDLSNDILGTILQYGLPCVQT